MFLCRINGVLVVLRRKSSAGNGPRVEQPGRKISPAVSTKRTGSAAHSVDAKISEIRHRSFIGPQQFCQERHLCSRENLKITTPPLSMSGLSSFRSDGAMPEKLRSVGIALTTPFHLLGKSEEVVDFIGGRTPQHGRQFGRRRSGYSRFRQTGRTHCNVGVTISRFKSFTPIWRPFEPGMCVIQLHLCSCRYRRSPIHHAH